MIKPLISVIIVAYKSEKYINNCINSLKESANHAKIPVEVIVVINDKDGKKYYLPDCKVIQNQKNLGFAKAADIGAKKAKGEWLLFLNPDTITTKTALHELAKHHVDQKIAIIAPKHLNKDGSLQPNIICEPTLWNIFLEQSYLYKIFPKIFHHPQADKTLYKNKNLHYGQFVSGSSVMVKKALFQKVNGFDERFFMYFEDLDLCRRIVKRGFKIAYEPNAQVTHYLHQSTEGKMSGNIYVESLERYLLKYHGKMYTFIAVFLFKLGCIARLIYWTFRIRLSLNKKVKEFGQKKIIFCKEVIKKVSKL